MVIEIDINYKQLDEKLYSFLESKKQQINDAILLFPNFESVK